MVFACVLIAGCSHQEPPPAPTPAVTTTNAASESQEFNYKKYYGPPNRSQQSMSIRGKALPTTSTSNLLLNDFALATYRTNGDNEITLTAPEALASVDGETKQSTSAGPLHLQTGDGGFVIDGRGYFWSQDDNNSTLTISNDVVTTIHQELLTATNGTPVLSTNASDIVKIYADHFFFDRGANLVTYSGNVRAEDSQLRLTAMVLRLHRSTSGPVNDLVAESNVVIFDKLQGNRASGDRAVYTRGEHDEQLVTLTGNPQWENAEGTGHGTARAFVFDRSSHTFLAQDNAHFRLPATFLQGAGFPAGPQTAAAPGANGAPRIADLYAQNIKLQLPLTNGPVEAVFADNNVVIADEAGGSRATADHATYFRTNGILDLIGHAQWQSGQRVARAEYLSLNQLDRSFAARTNAYLSFSPWAVGQSNSFASRPARPGQPRPDELVEITAKKYDYVDELLTFREDVKASYQSNAIVAGTLQCTTMQVAFHSNVLDRIVAEDNVRLRQPATGNGMDTRRLEIQMRTNGLIASMAATGGVTAFGTQLDKKGVPSHLKLTADAVNAQFLPQANQVEKVTAAGQVRIERDDVNARGAQVVYTQADDTAVLTGQPVVSLPHAVVTADEAIVYDHKNGTIEAVGHPDTAANFPANAANLPGQLSPLRKTTR